MQKSNTYFLGLDTLRAYAFLSVFVSHMYFNFFPQDEFYRKIFGHGQIGVQIFFVLSAFLITYLSLREYEKTGEFSMLHFFKKRILRIWPVYFLVLSLSYILYAVTGHGAHMGCATMFTYFFGNACMIQNFEAVGGAMTISPMWSVSVEQQFYTVFPVLFLLCIFFVKNKTSQIKIKSMLLSIGMFTIIYGMYSQYIHRENWRYVDYSLASALLPLLFGVFLGYSVSAKKLYIDHIRNKKNLYIILGILLFISSIFLKNIYTWGIALYMIPMIISACIYIILATRQKETGFENKKQSVFQKVMQYLGRISYGLYAYHMFAVLSVQYGLFSNLSIHPWYASVLTFVLTVICAQISYRYIESWFLRFK